MINNRSVCVRKSVESVVEFLKGERDCWKVGTAQISSTGGWINRVVYTYSGILLSREKDLNTHAATERNLEEPKWEKPDAEDRVFYDAIYTEDPE